jgi:hypothetical protein
MQQQCRCKQEVGKPNSRYSQFAGLKQITNKLRAPGSLSPEFSIEFDLDFDSLGGESEFIGFYVAEAKVNSSLRFDITFSDEVIDSMVDTGADVSVIPEFV